MGLISGYTQDRMMFTGTSVRNDELKVLADANITVNVDSQSEQDRLLKIAVPPTLSVRVNPEIGAGHHSHCITAGPDSKFGLTEEYALKAYATAKKARVERFGIHMHIGSGILDVEPYFLAVDKLLSIAKRVHDKVGSSLNSSISAAALGFLTSQRSKNSIWQRSPRKWRHLSNIRLLSTVSVNPFYALNQADT